MSRTLYIELSTWKLRLLFQFGTARPFFPPSRAAFFFQGKRASGWTGTLTPRLPNKGEEGPPDHILTLDREYIGRALIRCRTFQCIITFFVSSLTKMSIFPPFEFTSAEIKIGVWINSAKRNNLDRPQFESGSAHEISASEPGLRVVNNLRTATSSPGLFPQKMGFQGKALGTRFSAQLINKVARN